MNTSTRLNSLVLTGSIARDITDHLATDQTNAMQTSRCTFCITLCFNIVLKMKGEQRLKFKDCFAKTCQVFSTLFFIRVLAASVGGLTLQTDMCSFNYSV